MKVFNIITNHKLAAGLLLFALLFVTVQQSQASLPDKIVKPDSLTTLNTSIQDFSDDHPFNRALITTYNTNPQLRSQVKAQYAQAETVAQALGGWRPDINLKGSINRNWTDTEAPTVQKNTTYSTGKTAQLNITQNLFKGGQTVAQVAQAKATVYAGFAGLASTEQDVLSKAINAYLTLWSKQTVLDLNNNNVKIKQKNLAQIQARYNVGELTLTDLSQAEADLAGAVAQNIAAQADVNNATEVYIQVIGEAPNEVTPPPPLINLRAMPASRADLVKRALANHPNILNAEYNRQAQYFNIDIAKSALLPIVDLTGQVARNLQSDNNSSGRQNSASVGISLTVPIYQRGTEWSQVRQTTQLAAKAKIDKAVAQRQIIQGAVQSWENWLSYASQIQQIKIQVQAAKTNVEGTRQENLVGERTILDVLTAENALLQAETNLTTTQQNYLLAGYAILAAMGELTAVDLHLPVEPYPVVANYEHVQTQLIGGSEYPTR